MSRLPRSIPNHAAASALGLDCPVVGGSSRSEKGFMRNLMNHTEGWGGNWGGGWMWMWTLIIVLVVLLLVFVIKRLLSKK